MNYNGPHQSGRRSAPCPRVVGEIGADPAFLEASLTKAQRVGATQAGQLTTAQLDIEDVRRASRIQRSGWVGHQLNLADGRGGQGLQVVAQRRARQVGELAVNQHIYARAAPVHHVVVLVEGHAGGFFQDFEGGFAGRVQAVHVYDGAVGVLL